MVGGQGLWRGFQRMEFVAAGEGHHQARQKEKDADPGNFFANSFHRLRGSHGAQHSATAQSGCGRAVRPLHLYGFCAGQWKPQSIACWMGATVSNSMKQEWT